MKAAILVVVRVSSPCSLRRQEVACYQPLFRSGSWAAVVQRARVELGLLRSSEPSSRLLKKQQFLPRSSRRSGP
jgi:hypothetical protein